MSGTTFVTLGYGDVTPLTGLGRILAVAEAGTGFLFLALIIGYVPVIYQAFSRREINISLLDAVLALRQARRKCCAAITATGVYRNLSSFCMNGKDGARKCWRAISPIRS